MLHTSQSALSSHTLAPAPAPLALAVRSALGPVSATRKPGSGKSRAKMAWSGDEHNHGFGLKAQAGFGLFELLLVGAATVLVAGAGYVVYQKAETAHQIDREVDNVGFVAENVVRVYESTGGYKGMTDQDALSNRVFPSQMIGSDGTVRNTWGGTVTVSATPVSVNGAPASDNNGFKIAYTNVGNAACANFAANAGPGFYDVQVGGTSVLNATTHALDMATLTRQCNTAASTEIDFIYGLNTTPPSSCAASLPPGDTRSQSFSCPGGELISNAGPYQYQSSGQQTSQRNPYCSGTGTVAWTPWSAWTPTYTCVPACSPVSTPESAPAPCPAGQVATASPYGSTSGTQTRTATQTCATPIGPLGAPTYSPWTITGQSCAPVCSAPAPSTASRAAPCPAGQIATASPYGSTSGTQTQTTTYSCATPVGPVNPSPGAWSAPVGQSCAPACVLPTPNPATSCDGTVFDLGCPAGQTGTNTYQLIYKTTASCPAPTGSYTWGAPVSTGTKCNQVNSCVAVCSWGSPPSTTPACDPPSWGNQTGGTWNKTATCNVWSYDGYTCPSCGPAPNPSTQTRTENCATTNPGTTGSWTQTNTWVASAGSATNPTCGSWSGWLPVTAPAGACTPTCPAQPSSTSCSVKSYTFEDTTGGYTGTLAGGSWNLNAATCTWTYTGSCVFQATSSDHGYPDICAMGAPGMAPWPDAGTATTKALQGVSPCATLANTSQPVSSAPWCDGGNYFTSTPGSLSGYVDAACVSSGSFTTP